MLTASIGAGWASGNWRMRAMGRDSVRSRGVDRDVVASRGPDGFAAALGDEHAVLLAVFGEPAKYSVIGRARTLRVSSTSRRPGRTRPTWRCRRCGRRRSRSVRRRGCGGAGRVAAVSSIRANAPTVTVSGVVSNRPPVVQAPMTAVGVGRSPSKTSGSRRRCSGAGVPRPAPDGPARPSATGCAGAPVVPRARASSSPQPIRPFCRSFGTNRRRRRVLRTAIPRRELIEPSRTRRGTAAPRREPISPDPVPPLSTHRSVPPTDHCHSVARSWVSISEVGS